MAEETDDMCDDGASDEAEWGDVTSFVRGLLAAKDREIDRLRADLVSERAVTAKLWRAVARLQCAAGAANEWRTNIDNNTEIHSGDDFVSDVEKADELLDGVVALTEAE